MKLSLFFIVPSLIVFLAIDHHYLKDKRQALKGGSVNEAFLRKGSLGKILKDGGYLSISEDTTNLAMHGMCADDRELSGFDYHNTFRLRIKLKARKAEDLTVELRTKNATNNEYHIQQENIPVSPDHNYYAINFIFEPSKAIEISFKSNAKEGINIGEIIVDGRFGRSFTIMNRSRLEQGSLEYKINEKIEIDPQHLKKLQYYVTLGELIPEINVSVIKGLPQSFFSGVFPGKKHHGYCRYTANIAKKRHTLDPNQVVPKVKLYVDHEQWFGQHGVINNKVRAHGRAWEIPAKVNIINQDKSIEQQVGLRFHGGIPARSARDYARNYRIYARGEYGNKHINSEILNGYDRGKGFKTIVFKNTYHANFFETLTEFNPFTHALALNVADKVGAIVPDHFMVDLYINDIQQQLFLGMEHLSERTVRNWLGHNNFSTYTYRNANTEQQENYLNYIVESVRAEKGEDAFKKLKQHFDINNVIGSIILNAYVANFDFCQGMEVFHNVDDGNENIKVTSINWDLDHSFMYEVGGKWYIKGDHIDFPMLNFDFKDNSVHGDCPRTLIYSWVYQESAEFRQLFRSRLEELLNATLSYNGIDSILDHYRAINTFYYKGKHTTAIKDLENYAQARPAKLLEYLDRLEQNTLESKIQ